MTARLMLMILSLEEAKRADDFEKRRQATQIRMLSTLHRNIDYIKHFRLSEELIEMLQVDLEPYLPPKRSPKALSNRLKEPIMPFRFEEIAYQAEMDRHESPEFDEEAYVLCGEDPDTRASKIQELRNMIYERGECQPPQMDDAFLLRFLRARRSVPARAHRLMVRYCTFREQNPHLWRGVDWFGLRRLGNVFEGVLYDRPDVGRLILCRLGKWDPEKMPLDDLMRGALLLLEVGIMQPKLQVLGGVAMVDCEGLTMKHMRYLTPGSALQAMNILGYAFPVHQRGVHVVNCSRVFETLFHFFKRLAPADELWRKVYFHGHDMSSLHRYIDPECLPTRYGGKRKETSLYTWLSKIKEYKNKSFDDDISKLGYSCDYD